MDQAPIQLVFERTLYVGIIFASIFYGLQLYTALQSIYLLHTTPTDNPRGAKFYIAYTIVLFLSMSFGTVGSALYGQKMWIEHRNDIGGPEVWYFTNLGVWYSITGFATNVVVNFMCDALLLYRCYIIWGCRRDVVAFPALVLLASTAVSAATVGLSLTPFGATKAYIHLATAWIVLTVSLNIMLTSLIVYRIASVRREIKELMPDAASVYTGSVAILVESTLPFTLLGVVVAVMVGANVSIQSVFTVVWGCGSALSPQLIILRVAMGRAWSSSTMSSFQVDLTNSVGVNSSNTAMHHPGSGLATRQAMPVFSSQKSISESSSDVTDKHVEGIV